MSKSEKGIQKYDIQTKEMETISHGRDKVLMAETRVATYSWISEHVLWHTEFQDDE